MDAPHPSNNGKWRLVRSLQLSPKEIMKPFLKRHEQQYSLFEDLVWIKSSLHLFVLQKHLTTARRCLSLFPTLHGKSYVWQPGISSLPTSATPVGIVEGKHDHLSTPATTQNSILSCPDAQQSHCGLPYAHSQVLKETWPGELLKPIVFCYKSLAFSNSSSSESLPVKNLTLLTWYPLAWAWGFYTWTLACKGKQISINHLI